MNRRWKFVALEKSNLSLHYGGGELPSKKGNRLGASFVSPSRGCPNISSQVRSAEKWETGFPVGTVILVPVGTDCAIRTFGIGVFSSHRKKMARSPFAYAGELSRGSKIVCAYASPLLTLLLCILCSLSGKRTEKAGRLLLFKSVGNVESGTSWASQIAVIFV